MSLDTAEAELITDLLEMWEIESKETVVLYPKDTEK